MNSRIQSFLDDLYEIDPALRSHEKELMPLISQLLKNDPGREPDAQFVEELRRKLSLRAKELPAQPPLPAAFPWQAFGFGLAGAVVATVVLVPTLSLLPRNTGSPALTQESSGLFAYDVRDVPANSFGDLATVQAEQQTGARNQSGGGGPTTSGLAAPQAAMPTAESSNAKLGYTGGGGGGVATDMMIYNPTEFTYTYEGELPELPGDTVGVLRREKNLTRPPLSSIASALRLGSVDLSTFGSAGLDSVSFIEDKEYGHIISVMLSEGSVSVSQNWQRWPHPENACRDDACFQRYRMKIENLPSPETAIAAADAFLKEHGVDVTHYGKAEMDEVWKRDYERLADKSMAYIPDAVQVLYPLIIDGRPVYDQGGTKMGLRVSVDGRSKRVSDMYGLQNQTYARSEYAAVTAASDVKDYLTRIDNLPDDAYPKDITVTQVAVKLGTPTLGNVLYYKLSENGQMQDELVVPALIFPVESSDPQNGPWRRTVTVPLAKELLTQQGNPDGVLY